MAGDVKLRTAAQEFQALAEEAKQHPEEYAAVIVISVRMTEEGDHVTTHGWGGCHTAAPELLRQLADSLEAQRLGTEERVHQ